MELDDTDDILHCLKKMDLDEKGKEKEEQQKRSDMMVEKIIQKQQRIEEERLRLIREKFFKKRTKEKGKKNFQ